MLEALNRHIYQTLVGFAGLAGAARLFISADPLKLTSDGAATRSLTALCIALVALTDAYTWTAILPVGILSIHSLLDLIGVSAALVALTATGVVEPSVHRLKRSVSAAIVYILSCLLYWVLLPTNQQLYARMKETMGVKIAVPIISEIDLSHLVPPACAALFLVSLAVLIVVSQMKRTQDGDWRPFTFAIAIYVLAYFSFITVPLLLAADRREQGREQQFTANLGASEVAKAAGWTHTVRFSEGKNKALVTFSNLTERTQTEVIFEDDGFGRYAASFWLGTNSFTNIQIRLPSR